MDAESLSTTISPSNERCAQDARLDGRVDQIMIEGMAQLFRGYDPSTLDTTAYPSLTCDLGFYEAGSPTDSILAKVNMAWTSHLETSR